MKRLLAAAALVVIGTSAASAQWRYDGNDWVDGRSGYRSSYSYGPVYGSSHRIGNQTHHSFSNGVYGSSHRIGNFTHHNFSRPNYGYGYRPGFMEYSGGAYRPQSAYRYRSRYGW